MSRVQPGGSWSSSTVLAGYGLSAVIGPTEPTPADIKRLNSRSGGEHAGHGNWMQTYRPVPITGSGRPKTMYNYLKGDKPLVQTRLPGLTSRKTSSFRGGQKYNDKSRFLGINRDIDKGQLPPVVGANHEDLLKLEKYQADIAAFEAKAIAAKEAAEKAKTTKKNGKLVFSDDSDLPATSPESIVSPFDATAAIEKNMGNVEMRPVTVDTSLPTNAIGPNPTPQTKLTENNNMIAQALAAQQADTEMVVEQVRSTDVDMDEEAEPYYTGGMDEDEDEEEDEEEVKKKKPFIFDAPSKSYTTFRAKKRRI